MANWTDLAAAFGYGTKLTSQQMQQLRDNITAIMEGAANAPEIEWPAFDRGLCVVSVSRDNTSNTDNSWQEKLYKGILIPDGGADLLRVNILAQVQSGTGGQIRFKWDVLGTPSTTTAQNVTSTSWVTFTDTIDISAATANEIYELAIEAYANSGAEWRMRHFMATVERS